MSNQHRTNGDASKRNANGQFSEESPVAKRSALFVETSLRDVVRVIFRHRRKTLAFFLATMTATAVYAFLMPKTYRSEAKLFVRLGRENVGLDATTSLGRNASVSIPPSREEELNTIVEVLRSRSLLDKVVDVIGPLTILDPIRYPPNDFASATHDAANSKGTAAPEKEEQSLATAVRGWLEKAGILPPVTLHERALVRLEKQTLIDAVKKTNVIHVAHEGPSPEVSQKIVDKLVDFYLDQYAAMNRSPRAHQFLNEQSGAMKANLARLEDELRVLKNSTGLASPAEQRQTLVAQIGRVEDELTATNANAAAAEAETTQLAQRLSRMNPTIVLGSAVGHPNYAADGMRQQLYTLQLKEKDLASRATDENIELKFVREQIAAAKPLLDAQEPTRTETTTGPNRTYEELKLTQVRQESLLASLRAKSTTLKTALVAARRRLETLTNNELRIAQLQRDVQILDASYHKYADSLEQARIDDSLDRQRISNINVAQPPTFSQRPVRPQVALALLLGFLGAAAGAFGLAFAAEYVDHSFKTSDESNPGSVCRSLFRFPGCVPGN